MVWKKKYNLSILLLILLLITGASVTHSQVNEAGDGLWSNEQWEEVSKGLNYEESTPKPKEKPEKSEPVKTTKITDLQNFITSPLVRAISILIIIALLVFTIYKLLLENRQGKNLKVSIDDSDFNLSDLEGNLPETDLQRFLRLALEKGDYKSAIRILFLTTLQQLNQSGFIRWKKDKTNFDYLKEMYRQKGYSHFQELTLLYEIIWYGDTELVKEAYDKISPAFFNYNNQLSLDE